MQRDVPDWKPIVVGPNVVPVMLKIAVKRSPLTGGKIIRLPVTANSNVSVWLTAPGEQRPCVADPPIHWASMVCEPRSIVPVRSTPAGWRIVSFTLSMISNPSAAFEFWSSTATLN